MKEDNERFFALILSILQLEDEFEESQYQYNNLLYIESKFKKFNNSKKVEVKEKCRIKKNEINILINELTSFKLDSLMRDYYNFYKEKKELIEKLWKFETEIGYINATLEYEAICNIKLEKKLRNQIVDFQKQKEILDKKIRIISMKMALTHIVFIL